MADMRVPDVLDDPDALVRLVLAGNEAAFARIVRLHRTAMVRTCFVVTLEVEGAIGAVGAAWPIAWDRLRSLHDPARLRPWLCAIAAREGRDLVVHGATRLDLDNPSDVIVPVVRPDGMALGRDPGLAGNLAGIPVEDRVLLALRHFAGLTPDELGQATGTLTAFALARASAALDGLGGASAAGIEDRLRAFADLPVGFVNIDAVARDAKVTHGDRRMRVASFVLAAILAAPVLAVPYLGQSGAWAGYVADQPTPSPAPAIDALHGDRPHPR